MSENLWFCDSVSGYRNGTAWNGLSHNGKDLQRNRYPAGNYMLKVNNRTKLTLEQGVEYVQSSC